MSIVSLDRAKQQLRITVAIHDSEVQAKLDEAFAIVLDYIGDRDNANSWDENTAPGVIVSATLLVLGALWEGRAGAEDAPEPISDAVQKLLRRHRDPPLA